MNHADLKSERNRGTIALQRGQLSSAQKQLEHALSLARSKGESAEIADCLIQLGRLFIELNQGQRAQTQLTEAAEFAEGIKDGRLLALIILNQGRLAESQHDEDTAVAFYEQSAALFQQINDQPDFALTQAHLARLQSRLLNETI